MVLSKVPLPLRPTLTDPLFASAWIVYSVLYSTATGSCYISQGCGCGVKVFKWTMTPFFWPRWVSTRACSTYTCSIPSTSFSTKHLKGTIRSWNQATKSVPWIRFIIKTTYQLLFMVSVVPNIVRFVLFIFGDHVNAKLLGGRACFNSL